jgi:hypothetical protein
MKKWIWMIGILVLAGCGQTKLDVLGVDKAQLRKTLRDDQLQFNADLIVNIDAETLELGYTEWDIAINGVPLGKSVVGAETLAMEGGRQKVTFRVIFPDTILVMTSPCSIQIVGFMTINDRRVDINFTDSKLNVLNLTNM